MRGLLSLPTFFSVAMFWFGVTAVFAAQAERRVDHDDFGLLQSKVMFETSDISDVLGIVIDSYKLEWDVQSA